jgi:hypothetical protein
MQLLPRENSRPSSGPGLVQWSRLMTVWTEQAAWGGSRPHLLAAMTRACSARAVNVHTIHRARGADDLAAA